MAISETALIAKWMRDNPEAAAAHLATDRYDYLDPKHTGSFIGREGNQGYSYWNPETASYEKVADPTGKWEWENTQLQRNSGGEEGLDMGWYINQFGDHVRGIMPKEGFHTEFANDRSGEFRTVSNVNYTENPRFINDPNNNTSVPRGIPNPNYDPDLPTAPNSDDFEPQEGGPVVTYPDSPNESGNPGNNFGGGGNTSWDWSQFESNLPTVSEFAPPYTPDYTLGQESPWGNAGVEGGNEEFYRTQFNNLNRQNQAQQTAAIAAALRRKFAAENPAEPTPNDWSWANNGQGLPEVVMAGGTVDNPTAPSVQEWITPGETTNYEIATRYGGNFANKDYAGKNYQQQLNAWMNPNNPGDYDWNVDTDWSKGLSAQGLVNRLPGDLAPVNVEFLSDIYNSMFDEYGVNTPEGGGATAKPGYALPVGMYPSGNSNE